MPESLFNQLLGTSFEELPAAVRLLHNGQDKTLQGQCDVKRGTGMLSRLFALITSLPPAGKDQSIEVTIAYNGKDEIWIRRFGRKHMQSSLSIKDGVLVEWLGLMRFRFNLVYDQADQCVNWQLIGAALLGLPLPIKWFAQVKARESARNGNYCFDVTAALPAVGLLVQYKGWLNVN